MGWLGDAARGPGPSAYNVACICAELGEMEECRQWLEQSGEPGGSVSRDQMASAVIGASEITRFGN